MLNFPELVFHDTYIDLGSGHGSPTEVDRCGSISLLPHVDVIRKLAEIIRGDDNLPFECSGSMVYAQKRYFEFSLMKAEFAVKKLFAEKGEQKQVGAENKFSSRQYFKWWAYQSLGNFELYQEFWKEYRKAVPALMEFFQDKYELANGDANQYAEIVLNLFLDWAAGASPSYYTYEFILHDLEKTISESNITLEELATILSEDTSQDELDKGLKAALLYQKPLEFIVLFLLKGARINTGYESALFFALRNNDNINLLLKKGADINYQNIFGKTPLYYAIGYNEHNLAQLLLDNKADTNHRYKSKAELDAIRSDNNFMWQNICGFRHTLRTPLMHAAQHADVAMIKLLLQYGADLNGIDEVGYNAANYAVMGGKNENLAYLESIGLKRANTID